MNVALSQLSASCSLYKYKTIWELSEYFLAAEGDLLQETCSCCGMKLLSGFPSQFPKGHR